MTFHLQERGRPLRQISRAYARKLIKAAWPSLNLATYIEENRGRGRVPVRGHDRYVYFSPNPQPL